MELLLLTAMQGFFELNYRYVEPSDRNWARFESAADSRQDAKLRLCLKDGSSLDISRQVVVDGDKVCGETKLSNPFRIEQVCLEKTKIRYLGLPGRKLVVGTPAGPDRCPALPAAAKR